MKPLVNRIFQRAQSASISRTAVPAREGSSKLGVILGLSRLCLVDMLHVSGGGFGS